MNNTEFQNNLAEARKYEIALSKWLQKKFGFYVLPTYDYSGLQKNKAPKLSGMMNSFVIPDLLCFKPERKVWVECKWKSKAELYRKNNVYVTGIESRLFKQYQQVGKLSGIEVKIMFLHVAESEIRGNDLDFLSENINNYYAGDKFKNDGMVFWDFNKLHKWGNLNEIIFE